MIYEAGFKKPGPGEIWWQTCEADSESEATKKFRERLDNDKTLKGFNFYCGPTEKKAKPVN